MKRNENIQLYRGFPLDAKSTLEELIQERQLEPVEPVEEGWYQLDAGIYSGHIEIKNVYHILKIFVLKEPQTIQLSDYLSETMMKLNEEGVEDGWQPTGHPAFAPEKFRRDQRDMMLCIWPDELLEKFGSTTVPQSHQILRQEELMDQLREMEQACSYMTLCSLGKTGNLHFELPLVVFSTETGLNPEEKVTVWYQAQVHGNEPASCDGALEMMHRMIHDTSYRGLLEKINLVVVPRANPEAAYLYRRMNYHSIDLNRDHMAEDAWETRILHRAFQEYKPDVVLDAHEFISYELEERDSGVVTKRGWELMTSPATSLNIHENIRNFSLQICGDVFSSCETVGISTNHFGTTTKSSIGRTFFGLQNCLSFLIETRGIGAGKYFYERRIDAQVQAVTSYLQKIAEHAKEIKETVEYVRYGMNPSRQIVLQQEASGEMMSSYCGIECRYSIDGTETEFERVKMPLEDRVLRHRLKPSAYLLSSNLPNIENILEKAENMGIVWEMLPVGTTVDVHAYKYLGLRPDAELEDDILAERMDAEEKCFAESLYVFPTAQPAGMLLSMLMEPDVTDSVGVKGTLYQQGLLKCEDIFCLE